MAGKGAQSASFSTLIGYKVGQNPTDVSIGSNNIIIGTNITLPKTASNSINIGGILFGTGSYSTITGNPFSGSVMGKVGVNIASPTYSFQVSGTVGFKGLATTTQTHILAINTGSGEITVNLKPQPQLTSDVYAGFYSTASAAGNLSSPQVIPLTYLNEVSSDNCLVAQNGVTLLSNVFQVNTTGVYNIIVSLNVLSSANKNQSFYVISKVNYYLLLYLIFAHKFIFKKGNPLSN